MTLLYSRLVVRPYAAEGNEGEDCGRKQHEEDPAQRCHREGREVPQIGHGEGRRQDAIGEDILHRVSRLVGVPLGRHECLAALLVQRIQCGDLPGNVFLNVNLPDRPLAGIKGIKLSRLAHKTHIDTVREGHDGRREYYWLVRQKLSTTANRDTDIWAIEQGCISLTPLHSLLFQMPPLQFSQEICARLLRELKE